MALGRGAPKKMFAWGPIISKDGPVWYTVIYREFCGLAWFPWTTSEPHLEPLLPNVPSRSMFNQSWAWFGAYQCKRTVRLHIKVSQIFKPNKSDLVVTAYTTKFSIHNCIKSFRYCNIVHAWLEIHK